MKQNQLARIARPAGFTLVELLVVIAIIAILGSVVAVKLFKKPEEAKVAAALAQIQNLQLAADNFQISRGRSINSLQELVPEDMDEIPKDPWGGDYTIENTSDGRAKVKCSNYESRKSLLIRTDISVGGQGSPR